MHPGKYLVLVGGDVADVQEALEAGTAHQSASLDQPSPGGDDEGATRGERLLGEVDGNRKEAARRLLMRLEEEAR